MPNPFFDDIWISIAGYLNRNEKARLARVSWTLNRIVEPLFYEEMFFNFSNRPYALMQWEQKVLALRSQNGKRLAMVRILLPYFDFDKKGDWQALYGDKLQALETLVLRMPNLMEVEVSRQRILNNAAETPSSGRRASSTPHLTTLV